MNKLQKKKILLFSTLNPYPFWAGSENLWFDFVADKRINARFDFHLVLADSPVTREKAKSLNIPGITISFYKHFNVAFALRNIYRLQKKISNRDFHKFPWYNEIKKNNYDLVWFNVAALADLKDLYYPVQLCKKRKMPYWLLLQHGHEDFFLSTPKEIETVADVAASAARFIFIAEKNRQSIERAIGQKLNNAFHSVNALSQQKIIEAQKISNNSFPSVSGKARFFNLGRFSPRDKAQHLLLESFAGDQWKNRNWGLSFIGISEFGVYYLKKLINFYGINRDNIKLVSFTENVFEEIMQNDVLLMPSLSEGTPFAMIESMACGRPSMGTPIGGIPGLIVDKETGWLTNSTSGKDISEKLEEVWHDRTKWIEYGKKAQVHVQANYNEEKSFAGLLQALVEDTNS